MTKPDKTNILYVVVTVGCLECQNDSWVDGVFTDKKLAEEALQKGRHPTHVPENGRPYGAEFGELQTLLFEVEKNKLYEELLI